VTIERKLQHLGYMKIRVIIIIIYFSILRT
jgi:hypothetical protein